MDRNSVDWRGYIPAITTPFTRQGEIDWGGWQELLEWMLAEGMHGIAVAGTSGEWFSLSPAERVKLFTTAVTQIRSRVPIIGGCSSFTPNESIAYARAARDARLDGILLTPPPYVVPNEREICAFYQAVSDAVPIPICVYNWPRGTNVDLTVDCALRLSEIEHVVAIKNSTGDLGRLLAMFFAVKDRLRYFGFPPDELGITLVQHQGGEGTIGGGGYLGRDHPDFYNAVWSGDLAAARLHGQRDRFVFDAWFNADYSSKFGTPQAVYKAALNLRGLPGGFPRPPILPLTANEVERVRHALSELGLLETLASRASQL